MGRDHDYVHGYAATAQARLCDKRGRCGNRGCIAAPAIPPAARCWRRAAGRRPRRSRSCGRIRRGAQPASTSPRPLSRRRRRESGAAGLPVPTLRQADLRATALPAGELRSCLRLLRAGAPSRSPRRSWPSCPRGAAGLEPDGDRGDHGSVCCIRRTRRRGPPLRARWRAATQGRAAIRRSRVRPRPNLRRWQSAGPCRGLRASHLRGDGRGHPRGGDPGRPSMRASPRSTARRGRRAASLYFFEATALVPPS